MKFMVIVDKAFVIIISRERLFLFFKNFTEPFISLLTFRGVIFVGKALCTKPLNSTSYLNGFFHIFLA